LAVLGLPACTGGIVAGVYQGERVSVDGDVFAVQSITTSSLVLRNFATGADNQARLLANAGRAAEIASGCTLASLAQDPGVNTYRATLDCP